MGEDELLIYQLISSMPGKSMSQKLNFFQDISKSLGIDAFGAGRDFVEEEFYERPNEVDAVWGKDPVASVLFDAVDDGMSPMEAYQSALSQGLINKPGPGEDSVINYMDLVSKYAEAEAKRLADRGMFDQKQANARALFEAEDQPGWDDLFNAPTLFEAAGSPTEETLAQEYVRGDSRFRSASNMKKQQDIQDRAGSVMRAGLSAGLAPFGKAPRERTAPSSGAPRFSDDPVLNEFVQRISREKARKELPIMQSRMAPTAKGQQAMRALAMLKMFGG